MKIARELNLNESLEELVQEKLDVLQNEKARVVFYKEETGGRISLRAAWSYYILYRRF